MFKNHLKIAFRNLRRYKGHFLINMAGLAIGIACCLLIVLFIRDEYRFDRFHEYKNQIFRVIVQQPGQFYMGTDNLAVTPAPLASALKEEFPEVIAATRIYRSSNIIMSIKAGLKGSTLRRILVIFQFAASIVLIINTVIIHSQIGYIRNKKLGFNREQVVVLPVRDRELRENAGPFKNELLQNPAVIGCAASSWLPNNIRTNVGDTIWEGMEEGADLQVYLLGADYDFIDLFEMELVEGRNFSREFSTDSQSYILNETARKIFGWEKAVGKQFGIRSEETGLGQVIGVVKDFHFLSLHQKIQPLVIHLAENWAPHLSLKINTENIPRTLGFLEEKWKKFSPNYPFEYFFLDDDFEKMYRSEMRLGKTLMSFSVLAVFIACLGLFGLASFTSEQRTKEIGVRKVLGASVSNIVVLLSKEFSTWVLIASLIAWPVAYFTVSQWLQSFSYRISIGIWIFLLATVLSLFVAVITVSFKAVKAALTNPADALRYE